MSTSFIPSILEQHVADLEPTTGEIVGLANRLAYEMRFSFLWYAEQRGEDISETAGDMAKRAIQTPLDKLTWAEAGDIARVSLDDAIDHWERVKQQAREELASGTRASLVVKQPDEKPIDRARFIVLRESLVAEWRPRNGIERSLIDGLAQAITMKERAIQTLIEREGSAATEDMREAEAENMKNRDQYLKWGTWIRPRVSVKEATDEAKADIDRWDRIMVRTVRQLRDLRRYDVTINNLGQVNIADQQVNVKP